MRLCRRTLVWILVWLYMGCAVAESRLCVVAKDCAALLSMDGGEILAPGEYEDLFCVVDGERYAVGRSAQNGMLYGLCNADGELLTEIAYEMFASVEDVILFRQEGLCGAMDLEGRILLEAIFTQLVPCRENAFLALIDDPYDDSADMIWRIELGEETMSVGVRTASGLELLSEGRMPFRSPDTECYGCIDGSGKVVLEAEYDYLSAFKDGVARASKDGKLGVVDRDGAWKILPEYDFLERGDGIFVALMGRERCVVYDADDCVERFRIEGNNLRAAAVSSYPIVVNNGGMRVYTADGSLLLEAPANATISPGAGKQMILSDGDWGAKCESVIDEDGTQSERRDQHLLALDEHRYAYMTMNVATYYSDALQSIRYSCDYDSMRFGMLDLRGREILPAEYLELRWLGENRYLTVAETGLQVVDGEGNVLWSRLEEE